MQCTATSRHVARTDFISSGKLPPPATAALLQNNARNDSVIAYDMDLGNVHEAPASCWLMLAYDDLYSIQYMKKNLRPYWRRNGWEAADLVESCGD